MRITNVETYLTGTPWKRWVFVKVETSDGSYGVSEATVYLNAETVAAAIKESRRFYIGKDPLRIEQLWHEWHRDLYYVDSLINISALSAVEIACWDIAGKKYGAPIHALLGGACHEKIKAYANAWYTHVRTPEQWGERAKKVVSMGYRALKFDPFGSTYLKIDRDRLSHAIEVVRAVREAVGDSVELMIEGHGRFTPALAIQIAKKIEEFEPSWFEEPVPPGDVNALVKVSEKTRVPIAAGERAITKFGFTEMIETGAVDVIQPDPINAGGLLETKKICAMAEAHYVGAAPHSAEGPICSAVCVQLDFCTPNVLIQETFDDFDIGWRKQAVTNPVRVVDGYFEMPKLPGLGLDINYKNVAKHPGHDIADFMLFEEGWEDRNLPQRTDKRARKQKGRAPE